MELLPPEKMVSKSWKDPVLAGVFSKLDTIDYCVLHGWAELHRGAPSDVDIAISASGLSALERGLRSIEQGRLVQSYHYDGGGHFFVVAREHPSGVEFTQIDAITEYQRARRVLLEGSVLLEGKRKWRDLWIAGPESEFSYLLAKKICKRDFPEHQRERIADLRRLLGQGAHRIMEDLLGKEAAEQMDSWLQAGDWPSIQASSGRLQAALKRNASRLNRHSAIRYWTGEMRRAYWRVRHPCGLMVAVLGPDGSGKTSLIEGLIRATGPMFRRSEVFHLRPDVFNTNEDRGPVTDPHGQPLRGTLGSAAKLCFYWFDYTFGYFKTIRPGLVRGRQIIFDRYFDDILADPRRYRHRGPSWLLRAVRRLTPRPDLVLVLDSSVAALQSRKQEVSPPEALRQTIAYRKLAASVPNAWLIDADAPKEAVLAQAVSHVVDHFGRVQREKAEASASREELLGWVPKALNRSCETIDTNSNKLNGSEAYPSNEYYLARLTNGRAYLLPRRSAPMTVAGLDLYKPQKLAARVAKAAAMAAIRLGLADNLFVSVAAQRCTGMPDSSDVFDFIRSFFSEEIRFAVSLGTLSRQRKPVLQVMDAGAKILGYAKVGWNPESIALVQNEAEIGRQLANDVRQGLSYPKVLHDGWLGSRFLLLESPAPRATNQAPRKLGEAHVRATNELARIRSVSMPLADSQLWRTAAATETLHEPRASGWLLKRLIDLVGQRFGGDALVFHPSHGDFTPWNSALTPSGLYLFDWEYARWEAPAGWDLVHFAMRTGHLIKHLRAEKLVKFVRCELARLSNYKWREAITDGRLNRLMLIYAAVQLAFYLREDPESHTNVKLYSSIATTLIDGEVRA